MDINELNILLNSKPNQPLGHEVAGDIAEIAVSESLKMNSDKSFKIFQSKRVPKPNFQGRYEIDIILLTPQHLYVLEVKNFTGSLISEGNIWKQVKTDGEVITFKNLLTHNEKKLEALKHYLTTNIDIPTNFFQQRVIFFNDINLDTKISSDPRVLTYQQLSSIAPKSSLSKKISNGFLSLLVQFLISEDDKQTANDGLFNAKVSDEILISLSNKIDQLRTWDEIGLYGGRILRGDAKTLILDEEYPLSNLTSETGFYCQWTRKRSSALFKALRNKPLGYLDSKHRLIALKPSKDKIIMHVVGNSMDTEIYLKDVEWFCKG